MPGQRGKETPEEFERKRGLFYRKNIKTGISHLERYVEQMARLVLHTQDPNRIEDSYDAHTGTMLHAPS
ncbi:hypothetical protein TNCV_3440111 [Trichonephila clavipes]|uniref:Uncharacterized protein n=1 Tax=Trichonephila clavipes TaxID=2585209 RepID=A0A8X6W5P4_TRICX|nr:hypothetical protein TNCV_3440111 [Trichonephila clavipes]